MPADVLSRDIDPRRLVELHRERIGQVGNSDIPGHWPGEDHSWSLDKFRENLAVKVTRKSSKEIEFDLVGVDASIANAFRRILMAEVPTVAIEHVYVWNNTSIIQDEVLSHRLGLVPLRIDPSKVEMRLPGDDANDANTVVFKLTCKCERNPKAARDETDAEKMYIGSNVLSGQLIWDPKGAQEDEFAMDPPRPVQDDILLAKLRPGQEIDMELHCEKGVGKDHAKFSPVATASYRLLPHIQLTGYIPPSDIPKLQSCFAPGVIGKRRNADTGEEEPYVADPRRDTVSREVLRHKEFEGKVTLGRVRDWFMFDIESTGIIPPEQLLPEAVKVLMRKIRTVREGLDALASGAPGLGMEPGR